MNVKDIEEVEIEIARLSKRIDSLWKDVSKNDRERNWLYTYGKHTGAIRRASLDLTRALSKMRK
jgi:hypothetical protein